MKSLGVPTLKDWIGVSLFDEIFRWFKFVLSFENLWSEPVFPSLSSVNILVENEFILRAKKEQHLSVFVICI